MRQGIWQTLALLAVLALDLTGRAQVQLGNAVLKTEEDVKAFNASARGELAKLYQGEPVGADSKKLIDASARYYVYRVAIPKMQLDRKEMHRVHTDFESLMNNVSNNFEKNKEFRKLLAHSLVTYFKEVLTWPIDNNRMSCVNAAVMLPQLARLKQDEVADFLIELIKDPKRHDAIKLYALRGLPEAFPARELTINALKSKEVLARRAQDVKRIDALVAFIERPWDAKLQDLEVFQYLRREAIKALAQAGVPAVEADGKANTVAGPVVYELLRVLSKTPVLNPPPTLTEKLEAAIGICQLKIEGGSDYLPDVGIYRVGQYTHEFFKEYQKDFNTFAGKGEGRKIPIIPWKVQSERLNHALKALSKNTDFNPRLQKANARAQELQRAAQGHFDTIKTYVAVNNIGQLGDLSGLIQAASQQPQSGAVYLTIKKEPPIGD